MKVIADFGRRAELIAYDPIVRLPSECGVALLHDRYAALVNADALLILNDWDEFKDLDIGRLKQSMATPLIIDPLGVLSDHSADIAFEKISYVTMGKA